MLGFLRWWPCSRRSAPHREHEQLAGVGVAQGLHGVVVDAAQQLAREDVVGRADAGDLPALEHDDPIGPGRGEGQVVQHDDDGVARPGPRARLREHVLLVADVEGGGGLVEQQQAWRLREDACERRARLLPAGQRGEPSLGEVQDVGGEKRAGDDRVVVLGLRLAGDAAARPGRATHPHDVDDPEREAQGLLLQEHGPAAGELSDREGRDGLGGEELAGERVVGGGARDGRERRHPRERAGRGRDVAREHAEQRGLAGAVRPDEREHLPARASTSTPSRIVCPSMRCPTPRATRTGALMPSLPRSCACGAAARRRTGRRRAR
ncbi:hypothetical protein GCM10025864_20330 [Luteimicrobium album]|uniref:Uncharacterized protein n=1 Tax=Luteimicrobium album TaxID=1054550 RepID=A0ABQ6I3B5_9MICO|nr:hypothetical protein GCM10025864_20330 [Luteimicrobium album]